MNPIERLQTLMPPHSGAGDQVDWSAVENSWHSRFPDDYQKFVEIYGEGSIQQYLGILVPLSERPNSAQQGMLAETANARGTWLRSPSESLEDDVTADLLICWGVNASADMMCWAAIGDDPNRWPVVIYRRQEHQHWAIFGMGMVEFLQKTIDGDFESNPMSGEEIWQKERLKFLHWREEERSWAEGVDPWTGKPDPYAGMFGD